MFDLKFVADLQSLPRASVKVRVFAALMIATYAFAIVGTSWQLHPGFTMTWVMQGIFIAIGIFNVPGPAMVLLTGRMTRKMAFMIDPGSYRKTFSETRSDIVRANEEDRKRSREL
jgi:hypothetical protein